MVTTPLMTCQRCERGLVVVLDRATWDASIAATAPRQSMSGRRSQSWWSPDHIGAATGGRDLPLLHPLARVDDADFRDANGVTAFGCGLGRRAAGVFRARRIFPSDSTVRWGK